MDKQDNYPGTVTIAVIRTFNKAERKNFTFYLFNKLFQSFHIKCVRCIMPAIISNVTINLYSTFTDTCTTVQYVDISAKWFQ